MAAGDILTNLNAIDTLTITIASLADDAGRSSVSVDNSANKFPAALVSCKIETGTLPNAGSIVSIFLLRENANGESDDGWAGTDVAYTPENAPLLGTLVCDGTTGQVLERTFDTGPHGPLGHKFGIGIFNTTNKALDATAANHLIEVTRYFPHVEQ